MPRTIDTLNLADAKRIIAGGQTRADELGVPYNLAVVDAGGGTPDQDTDVAKAAAKAFGRRAPRG